MCSIVLLIWGWWAPVWNMVACHVEHFCGKRRLYIQVKGRGAGQIDTCDVGMKPPLELLAPGKQDEGRLTCEGWGKCWPQWAKASVENPRGCQIQRVHNRSTCNASQIKFILLERATFRNFDTVDISSWSALISLSTSPAADILLEKGGHVALCTNDGLDH